MAGQVTLSRGRTYLPHGPRRPPAPPRRKENYHGERLRPVIIIIIIFIFFTPGSIDPRGLLLLSLSYSTNLQKRRYTARAFECRYSTSAKQPRSRRRRRLLRCVSWLRFYGFSPRRVSDDAHDRWHASSVSYLLALPLQPPYMNSSHCPVDVL